MPRYLAVCPCDQDETDDGAYDTYVIEAESAEKAKALIDADRSLDEPHVAICTAVGLTRMLERLLSDERSHYS